MVRSDGVRREPRLDVREDDAAHPPRVRRPGKERLLEEDWDAFAAHIAKHGYKARWTSPSGRHMDNVYLELGDWKFWVIFPVINRERIENSTTERLDPRRGG